MTNNEWQQKIDTELGEKKWNAALSRAIQQKASEQEQAYQLKKTQILIPFISVAMMAILLFLSLSFLPSYQQNDRATSDKIKFKQVYYSKLDAQKYLLNAQGDLWTVGMAKTSDQELLHQLSIAFEAKEEIVEPETTHSVSKSVIMYDEVNIAYPYNIYKTFTKELIFESPTSNQFYKYSGPETDIIFEFIDKPTSTKTLLIIFGIFIAIIYMVEFLALKYYKVKKRKETFDHITLERITRWIPLPYLIYIIIKFSIRPLTLTWWEILIPFILYQITVLLLMKRQKEPHPYIVERMIMFCIKLMFIITCMFVL